MNEMTKYGVVTKRSQLCPLCGAALNTETNPPTCPVHGSAGIEKRSEDEDVVHNDQAHVEGEKKY